MRVKKYLVETMPEAMSQIRQELGKDAVIVSTKEVKVGGFAGMFRKKMIEVTAAVDEESVKRQETMNTTIARSSVPPAAARHVYANRARTQGEAPAAPLQAQTPRGEELPAPAFIPNESAETRSYTGAERTAWTAKQGETLASSSDAGAALYKHAAVETGSSSSDSALQEEIKEMKTMMMSLVRKSEQDAWPSYVQAVEHRLIEQGVFEPLAHRIVQQAWNELGLAREVVHVEAQFYKQVKQVLLRYFEDRVNHELSMDTRVVYLAGPTGVGKTTTIAKMAADQMFRHRRKAGFITSDTYRIAAVEQLRTYASILNAPIEVVTSPNDLQRAMKELQDYDLILVDTAGRNYRNELYLNELYSMIKPAPDSETFLVLSLTMKTTDMISILERFEHQSVQRIIFTKADETDSFGVLVNMADRTTIPFSFVTFGQNVPDDLKGFVPSEWIDKLLGEHLS